MTKILCRCATFFLLIGAVTAQAATVVTDHVISQSKHAQTHVPVTFGQVFKAGDVPHGATLTATLDGHPVALQVDAKATHPDGSLRHAVLTVMVPSLPDDADLPLVLSINAGSTKPQRSPSITLPQLLATGYDAKVSLKSATATYTADARSLLQVASKTHTCKAWNPHCNVWLSGPLASAWVVNGAVTAPNGDTPPNLRVYFVVRAYAGPTPGTVGQVRTDIIVENSDAFAPQTQPRYTATLTSGSASYTSPSLTQYAYTRWHHVLWWNGDEPQVYLRQDTRYIQDSKAVSRYMTLQPDAKFLDGLRQSCPPLDHCDQTRAMQSTGAQAAIGPLPRWASVYIVDPDVRAYRWMLANTDALGAYSIHYRDAQTGWPVSIRKHPYATIANSASAARMAKQNGSKGAKYKADLLHSCTNNAVVNGCNHDWYSTDNPNHWDNAHQPAESYVAYMVTGDYYYLSELAFGASHNNIWSNERYRGFSKGLIGPSHGQVRGKAWVLREMADAAWLLPDDYPLKAEFNANVIHSLEYWNRRYTHNPKANPLGLMHGGAIYNLNGGKRNGVAPWQHNFLTWSAGHAAELGFAGAAAFRDWLAKFEIGLMTDWQSNPAHGYCWLEASAYNIQVKDKSGRWLPSYTAVYATTFPTLVGHVCNSSGMVSAMEKLTGNAWQVGQMAGYPSSATGFPANFQIGLAAATDSGLPKAKTAWRIFQSRSVKPDPPHAYNNYPNFAVLPRTVSQ
ncbi:MAG TPA: hypothetical protein VFL78_10250 [Rhodanobacteraceae bacterium]|nr:hypothetical protein [Rhodanobacteraceae bacterium]